MNNLMIYLETMGNNPKAPIVAIGAVFFDPTSGYLGEEFYTPVKLASDISDEARAAITSKQAPSIQQALNELTIFVSNQCEKPRYLKVWGNGAAFDNVILRSAYERCSMKPCWEWYNDLDVRTMVALGRAIGFDQKRDMPFEGERHNALADAIHQAKYVSAIHQRLLAPHQQPTEL